MSLKSEHGGDPLSVPGTCLGVASNTDTGEFVGLYALTPNDGTYIRGDGGWHTAAGRAASQVNGTRFTPVRFDFVEVFDPLDLAGKVPTQQQVDSYKDDSWLNS